MIAIIVLANEMDVNGNLNDESKHRADLVCQVLKSDPATPVIASGWAYRDDSNLPIANAVAQYLVSVHNLDSRKILREVRPRDTVGDAVFCRALLGGSVESGEVSVLTSDYHANRAKAIFEFVFGRDFEIQVHSSHTSYSASKSRTEQRSMQAFLQTFDGLSAGDFVNIADRLVSAHPFYNGEIYPKVAAPQCW